MADITKKIRSSGPDADYSLISLWEADLDNGTIYSTGDNAIGECYNDSPFDEIILLNGGSIVGLNSVKLTVANGERHNGIAGTGARIEPVIGATSQSGALKIAGMFNIPVIIEWLEINGENSYPSVGSNGITSGILILSSYDVNLRRLIIHDIKSDISLAYGIQIYNTTTANINIVDCEIFNVESTNNGVAHGIFVGASLNHNLNIDNCTVYNIASTPIGSFTGYAYSYYLIDVATANYHNLIGVGTNADFAQDFYPTSFSNATVSNNLSSDGTASGSGSLNNKSAINQFVSIIEGSIDLHLKETADAVDTGIDLGTSPDEVNIDINGRDRDLQGDIWDIGAHEYTNSSSLSLFIHGYDTINDSIDLYIKGYIASILPLYINGYGSLNDNIPLYTIGHDTINDNIPLYVDGSLISIKKIILLIEGWGYADNSYIPLSIYGVSNEGASGKFDSIPLFMYHDPSELKHITLFIKNLQSSVPFSENLNLFIGGQYPLLNNNIPLYICQEGIYTDLTLFIKGEGTYSGAQLDSDSLPLYIYRPNISDIIPLVIYNSNQELNNYTTLYIDGILGSINNNIPLTIPNVHITSNSYVELTITGIVEMTNNVALSIPYIYDTVNNNVPLIIYHNGGTINSYVNTYIFGAYLINDNISLSMTYVLDTLNDNINTYIRGY